MRLLLFALFAACLTACAARHADTAGSAPVTAFVDVTLLPAYGAARIEHATVIVRDGRIMSIARNQPAPAGAHILGRSGQYLAPGLADMHVHIFEPDDGALYLANGVTTVRNMAGRPEATALARRIDVGEVPGPHIYSSGRILDGVQTDYPNPRAIRDTAGMEAAVHGTAEAGYAAVKLYENLSPGLFADGVRLARRRGLQVYAHAPLGMSVRDVLALRIDTLEHMTGFDRALAPQSRSDWDIERWTEADAGLMAPLARDVAASGVWTTATFVTWLRPESAFADLGAAEADPLYRYASPRLRGHWRDIARDAAQRHDPAHARELAQRGHAARLAMMRALYEARAPFLIGTDAPQPFLYPGFSLQDELAFHRDAGIPTRDILRAASLDAARLLGRTGEFGAVKTGARADLLLLDADPEQDLAALREPAGVMAAGRWYDAAALQDLLDDVARRNHAGASGAPQ